MCILFLNFIVYGVCEKRYMCGGRGQLCEIISPSACTLVLVIKLRLSGLYSQHFYPVSHLADSKCV